MGALSDIRIVDFGHYVAGPLTGMLLADQGATVIKVDPLGGPTFDSHANATWNRGKQSINLDLKSAADLDIAKRLIAQADIVIRKLQTRRDGSAGAGRGCDDESKSNADLFSHAGFLEFGFTFNPSGLGRHCHGGNRCISPDCRLS